MNEIYRQTALLFKRRSQQNASHCLETSHVLFPLSHALRVLMTGAGQLDKSKLIDLGYGSWKMARRKYVFMALSNEVVASWYIKKEQTLRKAQQRLRNTGAEKYPDLLQLWAREHI